MSVGRPSPLKKGQPNIKKQDSTEKNNLELEYLTRELLGQNFRPSADAMRRLAEILLRQGDDIRILKEEFQLLKQDMPAEPVSDNACKVANDIRKPVLKKTKHKKRKLAKIPGQKQSQKQGQKKHQKLAKKKKKAAHKKG